MKKNSIKEIKAMLMEVESSDSPLIEELKQDERKGVQDALKSWHKAQLKKEQLKTDYNDRNLYEEKLFSQGYQFVAGIDEVGRGPLAGPVVAACVILDAQASPIYGLNDSKKLSLKVREELYERIMNEAVSVGIGIVDSEEIDRVNIYQATRVAMEKAVYENQAKPDYLLVDAMNVPIDIPQESILQGDAHSNSIAAASIIAKVTRDRMMADYGKQYPGYGFESNAGYGTKEHLAGIEQLGFTPIHRKTFAPIKNYL